jgi:Calcineurin-like phosphoesterase
MNIQLLSDLHLELHPDFKPTPARGADVLVLAGDIGSYQAGSRLTDDDFGLTRFSPRPEYGGWPTPVVFVPGNHEYDGLDFDATHARLRALCDRLGILWLERASLVLGGIRFIGTTLWSDFDVLSDPSDTTPKGLAHQLALREKAFRAANYYLKKAATLRSGELWLAQGVRDQALLCQAWLREALSQPFAGDTVVITHFAPSLRSGDPRYGLAPGTAGFCNGLDDLLPQATLWMHGHLHCPSDYRHQGCRVVANPMGYAAKGEQDFFNPVATFRVGS